MVDENLTTDGQDIVVTGQSLGGGLAALVGLENGVETHTFGMAPFQNQFEIIAERQAVRDMLLDPDNADTFGPLAEEYQTGSVVRQNEIERQISDRMEDIAERNQRPGGRMGQLLDNQMRAFNQEFGTQIDRETLREFREGRAENAQLYEARKPDPDNAAHPSQIYASTVGEEFTTNAGEGSLLGRGVALGSEQIIPTEQLHRFDLGANQTDERIRDIRETVADGGRMFPTTGQRETIGTRALGEGLSTHSPALNDLITNSQTSDAGGFDTLMMDQPNLRYSILHRPGLMGNVGSGKVGPDDDPSASRSISATNETSYRALSNSLRGDGELYDYTIETFQTLASGGRTAEGADADYAGEPTLNGAVTQFALQGLRVRTQNLAPGATLFGDDVDFAGMRPNAGFMTMNLENLEPQHDMNRVRDADGDPIEGLGGIHGYQDLQRVIYDTIRDQISVPDDQGLFESDGQATARITDEILGTSLDFRNFGQTEGKLNIPEGELAIGQIVVQTGPATGADRNLTNEMAGALADGRSTAVFMGAGDNVFSGSNRRDFAMLGDGNDHYISQVEGGAVISGNEGFDRYSVAETVGPVSATLTENTLTVVQNSNLSAMATDPRNTADIAVGMESFTLTPQADTIRITGLSGDQVLNGLGGGDRVDYRELDSDFRLYTEDGVTASGTRYTSRLSDGENTLYIIGIDDEDIRRQAAPIIERSHIPTEDAIDMLRQEQAALDGAISPDVRAALDHPSAAQMFGNLHAAGVETIPANISPDMSREDRVVELLNAGRTATQEAGLPMPEAQAQNDFAMREAEMAENNYARAEPDSYDLAG